MDFKRPILLSPTSEKDISIPRVEFKANGADINLCQTKIKNTITKVSKLLHNIDNLSKIKNPYFTKSETYIAGKEMLYKKRYELNDIQRMQREKYIIALLEDADPDKKKYILPSMLYDDDIQKVLKNNKREFGFSSKIDSTFKAKYFETFQVSSGEKHVKPDIKDFVTKNLNKILYNYTYRNSPHQQKKNEMKKVEEGLFPSTKKMRLPIHKKSVTVGSSPLPEKIKIKKRKKTRLFTMNIRDEVQKKNDELLGLKKQLSRLLIMKDRGIKV